MRPHFLILVGLCVAACSHGGSDAMSLPLPPVVTPAITDPVAYLAQSRLPNGDSMTPLQAGDQLVYRRFDFGHYQSSDSFLLPNGSAVTAMSFAPFGPFDASHGGGGDLYDVEGDTARAAATQDGGTEGVPREARSYFSAKVIGERG